MSVGLAGKEMWRRQWGRFPEMEVEQILITVDFSPTPCAERVLNPFMLIGAKTREEIWQYGVSLFRFRQKFSAKRFPIRVMTSHAPTEACGHTHAQKELTWNAVSRWKMINAEVRTNALYSGVYGKWWRPDLGNGGCLNGDTVMHQVTLV